MIIGLVVGAVLAVGGMLALSRSAPPKAIPTEAASPVPLEAALTTPVTVTVATPAPSVSALPSAGASVKVEDTPAVPAARPRKVDPSIFGDRK